MSDAAFWTITLLVGFCSLAFRYGFHAVSGKAEFAPWLRRALETLPAAVLTALLAPMALRLSGDGLAVDPPTAAGVLAALTLGVATRNFLWALVAGLAAGAGTLAVMGAG